MLTPDQLKESMERLGISIEMHVDSYFKLMEVLNDESLSDEAKNAAIRAAMLAATGGQFLTNLAIHNSLAILLDLLIRKFGLKPDEIKEEDVSAEDLGL